MPIHDQGYRRYSGTRRAASGAWMVIAAAGIRGLVRRRGFVALLLLAWMPFLFRAVQIWASASFSQIAFLAPTPGTFRDFLDQQSPFVFFVAIFAGAGLIANDRRANALQIYLAKPLTRADYVGGKLATLVAFVLSITLVPALLLLLLQTLLGGSLSFLLANLSLIPSITVFSLVEAVFVSCTVLALSSLSRSSRYVAVLYAGLVFFSQALFIVLRGATGGTSLAWVSMSANLAQLLNAVFRLPLQYSSPWPLSLALLLAVVGLSLAILAWRVKGVEIVT